MSEKLKAKRQVFLCVTKPENYTSEENGRKKMTEQGEREEEKRRQKRYGHTISFWQL